MAYTYQDICNTKASGTGRDVADLLGIQYPDDSKVSKDLFLMTAGNRVARMAAEEVSAGNGHGLYGEKKRRSGNGNGNGKASPDPLATIQDIEIVMAARLAAKKAGIDETGHGIRDAIENRNDKVIAFLDFTLSGEQRAILEKAVGVMTPEEREKLRREELIAAIRMAVLKAARLNGMRNELESAGFAVDEPAWFTQCAIVDMAALAAQSVKDLERIDESINSPTVNIVRSVQVYDLVTSYFPDGLELDYSPELEPELEPAVTVRRKR